MNHSVRYFELWDDMRVPGRWALYQKDIDEHGRRVAPWQFTKGKFIELSGRPVIGTSHSGLPLDFSLTELATPVVTEKFVSVFQPLQLEAEVQFLPAQVEGRAEPYFILNVLQVVRCIDDARCEEVKYWTPEDGFPEKVGKYLQRQIGLKVYTHTARNRQHRPALGLDGRHHRHRSPQTRHGASGHHWPPLLGA